MNITSKFLSILTVSSILIFSCSKDEDLSINNLDETELDSLEVLDDVQSAQDILNILTIRNNSNNDNKVWKIKSALLSNDQISDLDISSLSSVSDDEVIFQSIDGIDSAYQMTWKQRNAINLEASNSNEALSDFYAATQFFDFSIGADLTLKGAVFKFEINDEQELIGQIDFEDSSSLSLVLEEKTNEEYPDIPMTLNFTTLPFQVPTDNSPKASGFTGSIEANSLYYVVRDDAQKNDERISAERVIRFDLSSTTVSEKLFFIGGFVSKKAHALNGEIKVIGSSFINTYSLDLVADPVTVPNDLILSRFGSASIENTLYFFGGDFTNDGKDSDKLYEWDDKLQSLEIQAVLPEPKTWADGEVVDDKIYLIGGRMLFSSTNTESSIFVYDIPSESFDAQLNLNQPVDRVYAARFQNLIYIGGNILDEENNNPANVFFTVLDTRSNSIIDIPSVVQGIVEGFPPSIEGLTIINDKLYMLIQINTNILVIQEASL